jgi:hypothetical protein
MTIRMIVKKDEPLLEEARTFEVLVQQEYHSKHHRRHLEVVLQDVATSLTKVLSEMGTPTHVTFTPAEVGRRGDTTYIMGSLAITQARTATTAKCQLDDYERLMKELTEAP